MISDSFIPHLENLLLAHLHLDIPSHLLRFSNKGRNRGAGIGLKTCFLLYYEIKTYKVPCLLFYEHDYVSFCLFFLLYFYNVYF